MAFGLDQLLQRRGAPVAHAVRGEPAGESGQLRLEILGPVREGGERREQPGIGTFGGILDDCGEDLLLVADLIVDRLAETPASTAIMSMLAPANPSRAKTRLAVG